MKVEDKLQILASVCDNIEESFTEAEINIKIKSDEFNNWSDFLNVKGKNKLNLEFNNIKVNFFLDD